MVFYLVFQASTGKKLLEKITEEIPGPGNLLPNIPLMCVFFYLTENIFDGMKKIPSSNGENWGESTLFTSIDKCTGNPTNWDRTKWGSLYISIFIFQLKLCQASLSLSHKQFYWGQYGQFHQQSTLVDLQWFSYLLF